MTIQTISVEVNTGEEAGTETAAKIIDYRVRSRASVITVSTGAFFFPLQQLIVLPGRPIKEGSASQLDGVRRKRETHDSRRHISYPHPHHLEMV
jgi:hypothetical protein